MEDFFGKHLSLKFFYSSLTYPNGESYKRCQVTMWSTDGLVRLNGLSLMDKDSVVVKELKGYCFVIESVKAGDEFHADGNVYVGWKEGKLFCLNDLDYGCAESFGATE